MPIVYKRWKYISALLRFKVNIMTLVRIPTEVGPSDLVIVENFDIVINDRIAAPVYCEFVAG
jgi:hypothetical protein